MARVNHGENYIGHVIPEDLTGVVKQGRLQATQDFGAVSGVDIVTICVPTPLDKNKQPDTSYIEYVSSSRFRTPLCGCRCTVRGHISDSRCQGMGGFGV